MLVKVVVAAVVTVAVVVGLVWFLNRGPSLAACEAALRAAYNRTQGDPSAPPPAPPPQCSRVTMPEMAKIKAKIIGGAP